MSPPSSNGLLAEQEHRKQWPLPHNDWVMAQSWHHLLFVHWPVAVDDLRPHIPPGFEIDTFDGQAWVGVVPFEMSHIHAQGLPPVPLFSAFPELNVRTYIEHDHKPGVWFFSLDADHFPAVFFARRFYHLPYFKAQMRVQLREDTVLYTSSRNHPGAAAADFRGAYRPISPVFRAEPGTLEYWLTERYYLYAANQRGHLFRGAIHHAPWPLQHAEADIVKETTAASHDLVLPDTAPLLHYAHRLDILAWTLEVI
jgi:uncharacterized protein YqjF (DUF2071 family)